MRRRRPFAPAIPRHEDGPFLELGQALREDPARLAAVVLEMGRFRPTPGPDDLNAIARAATAIADAADIDEETADAIILAGLRSIAGTMSHVGS